MKKILLNIFTAILLLSSALLIQANFVNISQIIPREITQNAKLYGYVSLIAALVFMFVAIHMLNQYETAVSRILVAIVGITIIISGLLSVYENLNSIPMAMTNVLFALFGVVIFDYGARLKLAVPIVNVMKKL